MALKDVKIYYYSILNQYLEMKASLADFDEALQNNFITEDQLEAVKADIAQIEQNYNRLSYIMYLLELPQRKEKKALFNNRNKKLINKLSTLNCSDEAVYDENKSALDHIRQELKKINKQ